MSAEPAVVLLCQECGSDFEVSARFARAVRRGQYKCKCRRCARRGNVEVSVSDRDRRFWLTRFTDNDLASFASALFDAPFRPERFAERRAAMGMPDVMVAAAVDPDPK